MPGLVQESPFKRITVKELHPTFAAEVQDVDFANVDDETVAEIRAAVDKVSSITHWPSLCMH
jgi:alpha-ketoglutarate-dependent 2,4-dichlorophenoxyacetate dioxygenase